MPIMFVNVNQKVLDHEGEVDVHKVDVASSENFGEQRDQLQGNKFETFFLEGPKEECKEGEHQSYQPEQDIVNHVVPIYTRSLSTHALV